LQLTEADSILELTRSYHFAIFQRLN